MIFFFIFWKLCRRLAKQQLLSQFDSKLKIWVRWVSLFDRKNMTLVATNGSASIVKHFFNKSGTQVEFNQHINNINITKDNLLKVSTQVTYLLSFSWTGEYVHTLFPKMTSNFWQLKQIWKKCSFWSNWNLGFLLKSFYGKPSTN